MRSRCSLALSVAAVLAVAACGDGPATDDPPGPADALRVASFDFAESELLAEVYAQAAERAGVPVERLGAVGPREIVIPALRDDHVDLVPEYVGSSLAFAGVDDPPSDVASASALLASRVEEYDLTVLEPSRAVDVNVFVVTRTTAEALGLETISDLAGAGLTRLGGPAECVERPLCVVGLRDTYGVTFDRFVVQPSMPFTAESLRRGEIDVGVMFSTTPELATSSLVALEDDRGLQPPDHVVPIVRRAALARWAPDLEATLDLVSRELTTDALRRLNAEVAAGTPIAQVACDWLSSLSGASSIAPTSAPC